MTIHDIDIHATVTADSTGQWLVLSDEADMDDAQVSGRWMKAQATQEVTQ